MRSLDSRLSLWLLFASLFLLCYVLDQSQERSPRSRLSSYWPNLTNSHPKNNLQEGRVAVCLVGGARSFELTGPTLNRHILNVYRNSDVFLHAPLDKDSFKLFLLSNKSSRFASARIFRPWHIHEEPFHTEVLTSSGSPNGIQGLLQYLNLVEGCWNMISEYEKQKGIKYQWILRTRVDGYWNQPLPDISSFDSTRYTIPYGSQFGGLNDRLGIGGREISRIALQRLTMLQTVHLHGYRQLNSERAFRAQMRSANVSVQMRKFPFCVLSSRRYAWPPTEWGVPVMAISSKGPLNGAKCRPCKAKIVGDKARVMSEALNRGWSWSGPNEGVELCDARGEWERGWEDEFDGEAGILGRDARVRVNEMNYTDCVVEVGRFHSAWDFWDGPDAQTICKERF